MIGNNDLMQPLQRLRRWCFRVASVVAVEAGHLWRICGQSNRVLKSFELIA